MRQNEAQNEYGCRSLSAGTNDAVARASRTLAPHAKQACTVASDGRGYPGLDRTPFSAQQSRGYRWKTLFLPDGTDLRMETARATYYARVEGDQIIFDGRSVSPRGMTLAIAGEGRNAWRDLWLKPPGERFWKQATRCRNELKREELEKAELNHGRGHDELEYGPDHHESDHHESGHHESDHPESDHHKINPPELEDHAFDQQESEQHARQGHTAREAARQRAGAVSSRSPLDGIVSAANAMAQALQTTLALVEHCNAQTMPKVDRRGRKHRRESDLLADDCSFD